MNWIVHAAKAASPVGFVALGLMLAPLGVGLIGKVFEEDGVSRQGEGELGHGSCECVVDGCC